MIIYCQPEKALDLYHNFYYNMPRLIQKRTGKIDVVVDENGFTRLAALSEVAPGEMVQVVFEEDQTEVAVANVDGKIYAFGTFARICYFL